MKLTLLPLLLLLAMLGGSGCSSVTTTHPLSSDHKSIDREKFEGVWQMDESVVHVKFSPNGIAQIAGLKWDKDEFRMGKAKAIVTEGKKHNFLSVQFQEDTGEWASGYYFLAYKFTDQGDLILWLPVPEVFEASVETKQLQGTIEEGEYSKNVTITNEPGALLEIINDPDNLQAFDYTEPMVLKKISGDS